MYLDHVDGSNAESAQLACWVCGLRLCLVKSSLAYTTRSCAHLWDHNAALLTGVRVREALLVEGCCAKLRKLRFELDILR